MVLEPTTTEKLNSSVDLIVLYKGLFDWVSSNDRHHLLNLPNLDQSGDKGEAK